MQSVSLFDPILVRYLICFSFLAIGLIIAYRVWVDVFLVSRKRVYIGLSLVFALGAVCFQVSYLKHPVDMVKLVELANVEKVLLQKKIYMERNKSLNEKSIAEADAWIKEMREAIADGEVDYDEYINLYISYSDLEFVTQPMYKWFAEHNSDQVESELRALMSAENVNVEATENVNPGNVETAENVGASEGLTEAEAAAMDSLVEEALSKN